MVLRFAFERCAVFLSAAIALCWLQLLSTACGGTSENEGRGAAATGGNSSGGSPSGGSPSGGATWVAGGGSTASGTAEGWVSEQTGGSGTCSLQALADVEDGLRQTLDAEVARCVYAELLVTSAIQPRWASRSYWYAPSTNGTSMLAECDGTGTPVDPFASQLASALASIGVPACAVSNTLFLHGEAENEFAGIYQTTSACGNRIDRVRFVIDGAGRVSEVRPILTIPNDPGPAEAAECLTPLFAQASFPCLAGREICLLTLTGGD